MLRVPTDREPMHPGEMLPEELFKPMKISQRELAYRIHVPYQRVNELLNERRSMTPSTALRLALFLGNSTSLWMNLQLRWDLFRAQKTEAASTRTTGPMDKEGNASS